MGNVSGAFIPPSSSLVLTKHLLTTVTMLALLFIARAEAYTVRFLAWDHDVAARKIMVRNGSKERSIVDLHPDKRSQPVTGIAADSELTLVVPEKKAANGKPATLRVTIPQGVTEPLVILLPDARSESGLRTFTIEDSRESFRYGSTRFFNTTGQPLAVRCEKSVLTLQKSWEPADVSPGGDSRNVGVQIARPGTPPSVLYSSIWEHDPLVRKIALIIPGTLDDPGPLVVKIIAERNNATAAR